jgi:hypothetical protein
MHTHPFSTRHHPQHLSSQANNKLGSLIILQHGAPIPAPIFARSATRADGLACTNQLQHRPAWTGAGSPCTQPALVSRTILSPPCFNSAVSDSGNIRSRAVSALFRKHPSRNYSAAIHLGLLRKCLTIGPSGFSTILCSCT